MTTAEAREPSSLLMSALTTEHYTLQSARAATIVETNGRSQLFLTTVSGGIVALALVAQLDQLGSSFLTFAFAILPALLALGITTYARLADLAVQDAYYARAIGRIRSFYFTIDPPARQYWLLTAGDDPHAVMRHAGKEHSKWHHLSHAATAVAVVNAVLGGVLAGLTVAAPRLATPAIAVATAAGVAILMTYGFLKDQVRRWRRWARHEPARFLPTGDPVPA